MLMSNYIEPGVYRILNEHSRTVLDLSGADNRTISGWAEHGSDNQLWKVSARNGSRNQTIESVRRPGTFLALNGAVTNSTAVMGASAFDWSIRRDKNHTDYWRVYVPDSSYNIDLNRGISDSGTRVQIYCNYANNSNQLWFFKKMRSPSDDVLEHGIYKIMNKHSGTVLDLSNSNFHSVAGWAYHGGPNQLWKVSALNASGNQIIVSVHKPGTFLAVIGGISDGATVMGASTFDWSIRRDKHQKDYWCVYVPGSSHRIDLYRGLSANGTKVQLWYNNSVNNNQLWWFEKVHPNPLEPGVYMIVNEHSGTVLDLSNSDFCSVLGWEPHGGPNQLWTVSEPDTNRNQTIQNNGKSRAFLAPNGENIIGGSTPFAWSIRNDQYHDVDRWRIHMPGNKNLLVDLSGGNPSSGTRVILFNNYTTDNQLWRFEKSESVSTENSPSNPGPISSSNPPPEAMTVTPRGIFRRGNRPNFFTAIFPVNNTEVTFNANLSPPLPQFHSNDAKLTYSSEDDLTGVQLYEGIIGRDTYKLTLLNGPVIEGHLNVPGITSAYSVSSSGRWEWK